MNLITETQIEDPVAFRGLVHGLTSQRLFRDHRQAWSARSYALRVGNKPAALFAFLAFNPRNLEKLTSIDEAEGGRLLQAYESQNVFDREEKTDDNVSRFPNDGRITFREFCTGEIGEASDEMSTAGVLSRLEAKSKAEDWEKLLPPDLQAKLAKVDAMKAAGTWPKLRGENLPTNDERLRNIRQRMREKAQDAAQQAPAVVPCAPEPDVKPRASRRAKAPESKRRALETTGAS